jgi:hypothetical protein
MLWMMRLISERKSEKYLIISCGSACSRVIISDSNSKNYLSLETISYVLPARHLLTRILPDDHHLLLLRRGSPWGLDDRSLRPRPHLAAHPYLRSFYHVRTVLQRCLGLSDIPRIFCLGLIVRHGSFAAKAELNHAQIFILFGSPIKFVRRRRRREILDYKALEGTGCLSVGGLKRTVILFSFWISHYMQAVFSRPSLILFNSFLPQQTYDFLSCCLFHFF